MVTESTTWFQDVVLTLALMVVCAVLVHISRVESCVHDFQWPSCRYAFNKFRDTKPGLSKQDWMHWVIIFPRDIVNCNFVGLGNVGCSSSYCYSWIPHDSRGCSKVFVCVAL